MMEFPTLKLGFLAVVVVVVVAVFQPNKDLVSADGAQPPRRSLFSPLVLLSRGSSPERQDLEAENYADVIILDLPQETDAKDKKQTDTWHYYSKGHQNRNEFIPELWKIHQKQQVQSLKDFIKPRINKRIPVQCLLNIVACWKK